VLQDNNFLDVSSETILEQTVPHSFTHFPRPPAKTPFRSLTQSLRAGVSSLDCKHPGIWRNLISCGIVLVFWHYSEAGVSIVYPPDKSFVSLTEIAVVGTTDETGSLEVKLEGAGWVANHQSPIQFGGFRVPVNLKSGIATLTVKAPSGATASIRLAAGKMPDGFKQWNLHQMEEQFANCVDCHKVSEKKKNYKRMEMGIKSCQSSSCHGSFGNDEKFVHGPVAGGVCISCHNPHGSPNAMSLTRHDAEMCFICHENKKEHFDLPYQHSALKEAGCTGCHDPHQSNFQYQLRAEGQELCFRCHDRGEKIGGEFKHKPVQTGPCTTCHSPHASTYPNLLPSAGNSACFDCHQDKQKEMAVSVKHPPAEDACVNCHDAHSSPYKYQLADAPPKICWSCHTDLEQQATASPVSHPPVKEGRCAACHSPHATPFPKLLVNEMSKLCSSCHETVAERLETQPFKHGPVADNDCVACHKPHGADFPRLSIEYFPPEFYNDYRDSLYSLCFQCHNADIARDKATTALTNFRDKSQNLHFLHINRRKGRSCKACHDVHASDQAKHIRRSVPFGEMYEYPIRFDKTEIGGSCQVGCHKPRVYTNAGSAPKP
jgi:predicted CXXCH cytochrome family protein